MKTTFFSVLKDFQQLILRSADSFNIAELTYLLHIPTEGEISWPCTIFSVRSIQRKYYHYILLNAKCRLKTMYKETHVKG